MQELAKKAMTATHRIYRISTCSYISFEMLLKTFETMVKPILLYPSELCGYQKRDDNMIESTFVKSFRACDMYNVYNQTHAR